MENGSSPGSLSPKVDHEKEEDVAVDEEMEDDDVTSEDLDVEEIRVVKQVINQQQQQQVNGSGYLSPNASHEQQEVSVEDEEILLGDSDEEQDSAEVRWPPRNERDEHDIVDLTGDDDDDEEQQNNVSNSTGPNESDGVKYIQSGYELFDWKANANDEKYFLWRNSSQFQELAKPFIDIAKKFGESCYNLYRDKCKRDPTISEFASYCVNNGVADRNWYGELVFVDSQRRGWGLQYRSAGKVFIKGLITESRPDNRIYNETVHWSYIVDGDLREPIGPSADELKLWQFDMTEVRPGERESSKLETCKNLLATVRKLMDCVWFPSDPELFLTFYNHVLYERLTLLFLLEYPSPYSGILSLSDTDKGKIIDAIKHYHFLKNASIQVYPCPEWRQINDEDNVLSEDAECVDLKDKDGDELGDAVDLDRSTADEDMSEDDMSEEDELEPATVKFEMDLKRHTVEMSFLLSPAIRPLLPIVANMFECDPDPVDPDEVILVMKDTSIRSMKHVYEELGNYGVKEDGNIRILPDLESAIKKGIAGTAIFVTSGNYNISGLRRLSDGGSIIGLKTAKADITVSPNDAVGNIFLFLDGPDDGTLKLKNLSLVVDTSTDEKLQTIIHVKSGQLIMENCALRDSNPSSRDAPVGSIGKSEGAVVQVDQTCVFSNVQII